MSSGYNTMWILNEIIRSLLIGLWFKGKNIERIKIILTINFLS